MTDNTTEKWRRIGTVVWSGLGIIALLAFFFYILGLIRPVLPPFIYAFIIVYLLRPIVGFFQRRRLPRLLSVVITYIIFFFIFSLLICYLLPVIIDQINDLVSNFPKYFDSVSKMVDQAQRRYSRLRVPDGIDKLISEIGKNAHKSGVSIVSSLPQTTTGLFGGLINLILGPIIAFYLLKDLGEVRETVVGLFPARHRDEVLIVVRKINYIVGGFLRGQALISLVVGTTIGLYLWAIGVKLAFLLGLISGVLNIIPYFGPIAGGIIAVSVALMQSPTLALWVALGMIAVQQFDSLVISPNIMRHAVDLHPALIIFSLLTGGVLFGFLGLLLAIPVAAVAKALVMYYFYSEPDASDDQAVI